MPGKKVQSPTGVFASDMKVINIGILGFAEDLKMQGIQVVQVDWSPPAGGDLDLLKLLEKLGV